MHIPFFFDCKKASAAKTNRLSFFKNTKKQHGTTRRCATNPMPFDSPGLFVHGRTWFSCRGLPPANLFNFKHALLQFARYGGTGSDMSSRGCPSLVTTGGSKGTFRVVPKGPKWPVPPKIMVSRCEFFTALDCYFFTEMSVSTKPWRSW